MKNLSYEYGECTTCGSTMQEKCIQQDFWVRGELIVVENVPAGVCPQCGEKVVRAEIGRRIADVLGNREAMQRHGAWRYLQSTWMFGPIVNQSERSLMNRRRFLAVTTSSAINLGLGSLAQANQNDLLVPSDVPDEFGFRIMWYVQLVRVPPRLSVSQKILCLVKLGEIEGFVQEVVGPGLNPTNLVAKDCVLKPAR